MANPEINKALELALANYRLTKLFPEGEVLIGQIRRLANEILRELNLDNHKRAAQCIRTLLGYFEIARKQGWTRDINFVILRQEYSRLLGQVVFLDKKAVGFKSINSFKNCEKATVKVKKALKSSKKRYNTKKTRLRQEKIINFLRDKKSASATELARYFKIGSRTIRNDFTELMDRGIIETLKGGRSTSYKVADKEN